jgi:hypothetical protein
MAAPIPSKKDERLALLTKSSTAMLSAMGGLLRHAGPSPNEARAAVDEARLRALSAQLTSHADTLMSLIAQLKLEAVLQEAKDKEASKT